MLLPNGLGWYIWLVDRVGGFSDPDAFVDKLVSMGTRWIAPKIADGVNPDWIDKRWPTDKMRRLVAACHRRGVQVWGWQYAYGYSPSAEADVAVRKCNDLELDGFIIDAEVEYKGRNVAAKTYMARLRAGLKIPLALSTYRFISYHPNFPWKEFSGVDIWMPQVYWQGAHNPAYQLDRTYKEYMKLRNLPFIPAGSSYAEHAWSATTADIVQFIDAAKNTYPAYFFWELYPALQNPAWIEAIRQRAGAGQPPVIPPPVTPPPVPTRKVRVTASRGLNYREQPSALSRKLGAFPYGTVLTIGAERSGWGFVVGYGAWVSLAYTKSL